MNKIFLDFRSDTVTRPGSEMLEAMMSAKVGDDVFGEDETVRMLESKLAGTFNMEDGLFCPSGTMTNQIAIKCFTNPMEEIICDQTAHVYRYEVGGIAYHSAASVRLLHGERGILTPELIEPEINEDNIHYPDTSLVILENTVNKGGGSCYTLKQIAPIHHLCSIKGLKLHLDGARVFNALAATGDKAHDYGKYFDGISVCLSKGLGAPVGSVLLGDKDMIKKARKIRKAFGGGMRQAGFLAAAGIYALDHNVERLKQDHLHAAALAETLLKARFVKSVMPVETNIVIFEVEDKQSEKIAHQLKEKGLWCNTTSPSHIRMVTHLDLPSEKIDQAIDILSHF
ncbi:threonine aldolase family protein [Pedobacter sp. AW1-32]|uniref:threonine aldolase family protein n=1 Tax=Pedobacter sp. AW1-32 TaxID=3383026 RepID=UPI003FEFEAEC